MSKALREAPKRLKRQYSGWRRLAAIGRHYHVNPPGTRDEMYTAAVLADAAADLDWNFMQFLSLRALSQHSPPTVNDLIYWEALGHAAAISGRTGEAIRIAEHLGALRVTKSQNKDVAPLGLLAAAQGRGLVEISFAGIARRLPKSVLLDLTAQISRWLRPLPRWCAAELFPIVLVVALNLADSNRFPRRRAVDTMGLTEYPLIRIWRRRRDRDSRQAISSGMHISLTTGSLSVMYRACHGVDVREGTLDVFLNLEGKIERVRVDERGICYALFDFHAESRQKTPIELQSPRRLLALAGAIIDAALKKFDNSTSGQLLTIQATCGLAYFPWAAAWMNGRYLIETHDIAFDDGINCTLERKRRPLFVALSGPSEMMQREAAGAVRLALSAGLPASEQRLTLSSLRAALAKASVVHVATHFRAHPHDPAESELQLSDGGWIKVTDVAVQLDGLELLFLAGCETGTELDSVDGPGGNLTQIWRRAGAQSVISTLWRIEDRASELITLGFYERLVSGECRAAALAVAQRWALRDNRAAGGSERFPELETAPQIDLAHPRRWAGFRLTGATGPIRI